STVFGSLLSVIQPEQWTASRGDREYWARVKSKKGQYRLQRALDQTTYDSDLEWDRLIAAAFLAQLKGGLSWLTINQSTGKRFNDQQAATYLALLIAMGVVEPAEDWQRWHNIGHRAEIVRHKLSNRLVLRGELLITHDELQMELRAARQRTA